MRQFRFLVREDPTRLSRLFALQLCVTLSLVPAAISGQAARAGDVSASDPTYLVIRADDGGMSHSVNMALERLVQTGMPLSVSVMFPTPWYQETVEILKRHPEVSVGIHLTLNSEWKNYRWGPVTGRSAVPSLVDSEGYFFASSEELHAHNPNIGEVERELRAQIERAKRTGLRIDYVDPHMGTATRYPEFRELTERLAREYHLAISGYYAENRGNPQYDAAPAAKTDSLLAFVSRFVPGVNLLVTHVGIDNEELGALLDMNTDGGLPEMSKNRQGELDAITSQRFRDAVKAHHVQLINYRQLIEKQGLQSMRRPVS